MATYISGVRECKDYLTSIHPDWGNTDVSSHTQEGISLGKDAARVLGGGGVTTKASWFQLMYRQCHCIYGSLLGDS
jgi:hypothetical protein